eukprot:CAMPEP_0115005196 /NCGR_PEP_ID=MMETSP0216-20121206/19710_1 /TAXON_ID=223996 /ORGANISM="Protocruzia adherens, Strain Boccale" /LENGTH=247 /DNA_ID=CAMNT_0002371441 /DNA_START=1114 /DNA_END=1857 /DNA_ORIENTATION=+
MTSRDDTEVELTEAVHQLQKQQQQHNQNPTLLVQPRPALHCATCEQTCFIAKNANALIRKIPQAAFDDQGYCVRCKFRCHFNHHYKISAWVDVVGAVSENGNKRDEDLVKERRKAQEDFQGLVQATDMQIHDLFDELKREVDSFNQNLGLQEFVWRELDFLEECELDEKIAQHRHWPGLLLSIKQFVIDSQMQKQGVKGKQESSMEGISETMVPSTALRRNNVIKEGAQERYFQDQKNQAKVFYPSP